jgi:hypothetical protein
VRTLEARHQPTNASAYYRAKPSYEAAERTTREVEVVLADRDQGGPGTRRHGDRHYYDDAFDDDAAWGGGGGDAAAARESYKLSATYWGGFRDMLATECVRLLQRREDDFRAYWRYASDLADENADKAAVARSRQEMAIYAFTIVTVIFLPLSAVSSIFGMNTSDIRELEAGQWAYWAVAVPVTIGVIVLGLWYMGELGAVARWLMFWRHRGGGGRAGYRLLGDVRERDRGWSSRERRRSPSPPLYPAQRDLVMRRPTRRRSPSFEWVRRAERY